MSSDQWVDTIISEDGMSTTVEVAIAWLTSILVEAISFVGIVEDSQTFDGASWDEFRVWQSFSWGVVEEVLIWVKDPSIGETTIGTGIR